MCAFFILIFRKQGLNKVSSGFSSPSYNNYNFYGLLSNYQPAGTETYCDSGNSFHQTALSGIATNLNQGFYPFGVFMRSLADVQANISKKTSAGFNVPLAVPPGAGTTVAELIGVSVRRRLGMYENDANWMYRDIYNTDPIGYLSGYRPKELITYTDRSRSIFINIASGTGHAVGSAITIDVSGTASAGSIASTGLALPITLAKAKAPAILFASDPRLAQLGRPGCVGVQEIQLTMF
jgi:hypothetical protein